MGMVAEDRATHRIPRPAAISKYSLGVALSLQFPIRDEVTT